MKPLAAPRSTLLLAPLLALALAATAAAKPWWAKAADGNGDDFLPPDVAFRVGATAEGTVLHVRWVIADGYYLYRSRMQIQAESPDLVVQPAVLPAGIPKSDPYLGDQQIYEQQVVANVPFVRTDAGAHPLAIKVTYQGCAEAGLCYPPITKVLYPQPVASSAAAAGPAVVGAAAPTAFSGWVRAAILAGGFAFFAAGVALRRGRNLEPPPA